jgi:polyisoprenoid-binding protein YceI
MTRNRLSAFALVAVVAVGAGIYLVYDNVLRGDDVAPLALPSSSPAAGASPTPATSGDPIATASAATGTPADPGTGSDDDVAGTWIVATGSEAGYRVREQLASLPAESDAVGRTSDVTGSITLVAAGDGAQLTEGSIQIDTTTIASDEDRRDNRMRSEGLQTDQFPTATFAITAPVDLPSAALAGTATDVTLVGDLTLHGVTKSVEIPAQAQLVDGQIQVAGSLTFPLADFDIVAPNVGGFIVSIDDEGALEFLVVFAKG